MPRRPAALIAQAKQALIEGRPPWEVREEFGLSQDGVNSMLSDLRHKHGFDIPTQRQARLDLPMEKLMADNPEAIAMLRRGEPRRAILRLGKISAHHLDRLATALRSLAIQERAATSREAADAALRDELRQPLTSTGLTDAEREEIRQRVNAGRASCRPWHGLTGRNRQP